MCDFARKRHFQLSKLTVCVQGEGWLGVAENVATLFDKPYHQHANLDSHQSKSIVLFKDLFRFCPSSALQFRCVYINFASLMFSFVPSRKLCGNLVNLPANASQHCVRFSGTLPSIISKMNCFAVIRMAFISRCIEKKFSFRITSAYTKFTHFHSNPIIRTHISHQKN